MQYIANPRSPYTQRLYPLIPTNRFIRPATVWRAHVPDSHRLDEQCARDFLQDLQDLSELGALEKTVRLVHGEPYSVYRRVEGFWILPLGWQPPGGATQGVADDYERRLRATYPVVQLGDGMWVRVKRGEVMTSSERGIAA